MKKLLISAAVVVGLLAAECGAFNLNFFGTEDQLEVAPDGSCPGGVCPPQQTAAQYGTVTHVASYGCAGQGVTSYGCTGSALQAYGCAGATRASYGSAGSSMNRVYRWPVVSGVLNNAHDRRMGRVTNRRANRHYRQAARAAYGCVGR